MYYSFSFGKIRLIPNAINAKAINTKNSEIIVIVELDVIVDISQNGIAIAPIMPPAINIF